MGMVVVAFLIATAWTAAGAIKTFGLRFANSAASVGAVVVAIRKSIHDVEIPTFGVPELSHTFQEWREKLARAHVSVCNALRTTP
jgi:hypothetical protein